MMDNTIEFEVFTSYYVDPQNPTRSCFAAMYAQAGINKVRQFTMVSSEDTYMSVWMKGVSAVLTELEKFTHHPDITPDTTIQFTIYMWHPNIQAIGLKLNSVYRDLAPFVDDVSALMNVKLRKKNKQRYDHHDDQARILNTLLDINKRVRVKLKFKPLPPTSGLMPAAYQLANATYTAAFE